MVVLQFHNLLPLTYVEDFVFSSRTA